jgi:hypothetical protein
MNIHTLGTARIDKPIATTGKCPKRILPPEYLFWRRPIIAHDASKGTQAQRFRRQVSDAGKFDYHQQIIWSKTQASMTRNHYLVSA